ncbi:MAG: patatin-like phospholipase family protein [Bacteroidota bacterium]
MMKKVGIVLSGGGARGFGHLGVLKALEEIDITPSIMAGSSAGAIVAAFYSAGYEPEEIMEIARKGNFFSMSNLMLRKASGLFAMKSFEQIYLKCFPKDLIEALPIPVCIAATDMIKAKTKYFTEGSLAKALMASSCLPLVFEPIHYNDGIYLDGGILNNLPVEALVGKCDFIIGVHVNEMSPKLADFKLKDMLDRTFHLTMSKTVYDKASQCDLFIDPPNMSRFGMFEVQKAEEIFLYCYHYTKELLNQKEVFDCIEDLV